MPRMKKEIGMQLPVWTGKPVDSKEFNILAKWINKTPDGETTLHTAIALCKEANCEWRILWSSNMQTRFAMIDHLQRILGGGREHCATIVDQCFCKPALEAQQLKKQICLKSISDLTQFAQLEVCSGRNPVVSETNGPVCPVLLDYTIYFLKYLYPRLIPYLSKKKEGKDYVSCRFHSFAPMTRLHMTTSFLKHYEKKKEQALIPKTRDHEILLLPPPPPFEENETHCNRRLFWCLMTTFVEFIKYPYRTLYHALCGDVWHLINQYVYDPDDIYPYMVSLPKHDLPLVEQLIPREQLKKLKLALEGSSSYPLDKVCTIDMASYSINIGSHLKSFLWMVQYWANHLRTEYGNSSWFKAHKSIQQTEHFFQFRNYCFDPWSAFLGKHPVLLSFQNWMSNQQIPMVSADKHWVFWTPQMLGSLREILDLYLHDFLPSSLLEKQSSGKAEVEILQSIYTWLTIYQRTVPTAGLVTCNLIEVIATRLGLLL